MKHAETLKELTIEISTGSALNWNFMLESLVHLKKLQKLRLRISWKVLTDERTQNGDYIIVPSYAFENLTELNICISKSSRRIFSKFFENLQTVKSLTLQNNEASDCLNVLKKMQKSVKVLTLYFIQFDEYFFGKLLALQDLQLEEFTFAHCEMEKKIKRPKDFPEFVLSQKTLKTLNYGTGLNLSGFDATTWNAIGAMLHTTCIKHLEIVCRSTSHPQSMQPWRLDKLTKLKINFLALKRICYNYCCSPCIQLVTDELYFINNMFHHPNETSRELDIHFNLNKDDLAHLCMACPSFVKYFSMSDSISKGLKEAIQLSQQVDYQSLHCRCKLELQRKSIQD